MRIFLKTKIEAKLEKLSCRKKVLATQMQKLEASSKVAARKRELQKKILVGAYVLEQASKNGTMESLKASMLEYLQRSSDRKLFE
jgi:hypothetical protein